MTSWVSLATVWDILLELDIRKQSYEVVLAHESVGTRYLWEPVLSLYFLDILEYYLKLVYFVMLIIRYMYVLEW